MEPAVETVIVGGGGLSVLPRPFDLPSSAITTENSEVPAYSSGARSFERTALRPVGPLAIQSIHSLRASLI
jgi:hypothetical protein